MAWLREIFDKIFGKGSKPVAVDGPGEDIREREAAIYGQERIDLQRLYERWVSRPAWLLKSQALPLLLGRDPEGRVGDDDYMDQVNELWAHAQECVKKRLLKLENSDTEDPEKWEVSPAVIYQWAAVSRIELEDSFIRLMEFILTVVKKDPGGAHSEAVAIGGESNQDAGFRDMVSEKERILGASLSVLAGYYDECKNRRGVIKTERVIDMINKYSDALFDQDAPDLSPPVMKDVIDVWLKKLV